MVHTELPYIGIIQCTLVKLANSLVQDFSSQETNKRLLHNLKKPASQRKKMPLSLSEFIFFQTIIKIYHLAKLDYYYEHIAFFV